MDMKFVEVNRIARLRIYTAQMKAKEVAVYVHTYKGIRLAQILIETLWASIAKSPRD
jgi:hypothetical protein